MSSFALRKGASKRRMNPIWSFTPFSPTARSMSSASSTRTDMGFSQNTCFFASAHRRTTSRCVNVGVTTITASKRSRERASSRSVKRAVTPISRPLAFSVSSSLSTSAVITPLVMLEVIFRACTMPARPAPIRQNRSVSMTPPQDKILFIGFPKDKILFAICQSCFSSRVPAAGSPSPESLFEG
jgi:hypothetical protein